mmetsp:Transcript_106779/g.297200  ORF Transcript_106779/g.297200 Transcript_106779/m.297200 type:complete len:226 (-) Transcript_106779:556-1233(-)
MTTEWAWAPAHAVPIHASCRSLMSQCGMAPRQAGNRKQGATSASSRGARAESSRATILVSYSSCAPISIGSILCVGRGSSIRPSHIKSSQVTSWMWPAMLCTPPCLQAAMSARVLASLCWSPVKHRARKTVASSIASGWTWWPTSYRLLCTRAPTFSKAVHPICCTVGHSTSSRTPWHHSTSRFWFTGWTSDPSWSLPSSRPLKEMQPASLKGYPIAHSMAMAPP